MLPKVFSNESSLDSWQGQRHTSQVAWLPGCLVVSIYRHRLLGCRAVNSDSGPPRGIAACLPLTIWIDQVITKQVINVALHYAYKGKYYM